MAMLDKTPRRDIYYASISFKYTGNGLIGMINDFKYHLDYLR